MAPLLSLRGRLPPPKTFRAALRQKWGWWVLGRRRDGLRSAPACLPSFEHTAWLTGTHTCTPSSGGPSCPSSTLLPSPALTPPQPRRLQKCPPRPSGPSLGRSPAPRGSRRLLEGRLRKHRHMYAPLCPSPAASPAPGAQPALPGGIVTWTGGSRAGPARAVRPTLSLSFYFCSHFSSCSALAIFAPVSSISEVVLYSVLPPPSLCGAPQTLSL